MDRRNFIGFLRVCGGTLAVTLVCFAAALLLIDQLGLFWGVRHVAIIRDLSGNPPDYFTRHYLTWADSFVVSLPWILVGLAPLPCFCTLAVRAGLLHADKCRSVKFFLARGLSLVVLVVLCMHASYFLDRYYYKVPWMCLYP